MDALIGTAAITILATLYVVGVFEILTAKREPMSETPGLDALKELHRKLGKLLEDPEPGLATWRIMLRNTLLEMVDYAGSGKVSEVIAKLEREGTL